VNANKAIELLRRISLFDLAGTDGCMCMSCQIQGVSIEVSCRKSSGSSVVKQWEPDFYGTVVRVYSNHLDALGDELKRIADEVVRQIQPEVGSEPIRVRLCDHDVDERMVCQYCRKPRQLGPFEFCDEHKNRA
jgi:hypothetical protein